MRLPRALVIAAACLGVVGARLPGRQGQGLAPAHARRTTTRPSFKQAVVSSEGVLRLARQLQAAGRPRRHPRLGRGRGQGRQPVRGHRRRGQGVTRSRPTARRRWSTPARRARCSAWRRAGDGAVYAGTGPNGEILRIDAARQGEGRLRHRRAVRLVAGRGRQDGDALRRHRAEGPHLPDHPRGQGERLLHRRSRNTSSAWRPAPTARSTPAPTRAAWSTASTPRARVRALPGGPGRGAHAPGDGRRRLRRHQRPDQAARRRPWPARRPAASARRPPTWRRPVQRRPPSLGEAAGKDDAPAKSAGTDGDFKEGKGSRRAGPVGAVGRRELGLPHRPRRQRARGVPREGAGPEPAAAAAAASSSAPAWTASSSRSTRRRASRRDRPARPRPDPVPVPRGATARSSSAPATPASSTSCEDRYAAKGTVMSEVLDAKLVSKWGALRWQADAPAGTSRDAWPCAAATSPSRTTPGATGRPSRPTPNRR